MPAAARKRHPHVVPNERAQAPQRQAATGRPLRNPNVRRQAAAGVQAASVTASAQRQLDERMDPAYESFLESSAKARTARRRARRRHQPFHLTWQASVAGCILMAQLVALLWMQGVALSARNRSYKLDKDIADKYSNVTRTQNEIARLASASRIAQWAHERGLTVAGEDRFDSINNLMPVTENETAPAGAATSNGVSTASNVKHNKHQARQRHRATPVKVEIQIANSNTATENGVATVNTLPDTAIQTPNNDSQGNHDSSPQAGDD